MRRVPPLRCFIRNTCPVYEIAEAEGQTFISMAYIEGRSLRDCIAEGPLPLDEKRSR